MPAEKWRREIARHRRVLRGRLGCFARRGRDSGSHVFTSTRSALKLALIGCCPGLICLHAIGAQAAVPYATSAVPNRAATRMFVSALPMAGGADDRLINKGG